MSCDDPDCPGCLALGLIETLEDQGFGCSDMVSLFVEALGVKFPEVELVIEKNRLH